MEAILILALLIGLAVAAVLWGQDGRPRRLGKEADQALWGLTWADRGPSASPGPHVRPELSALAAAQRIRREEAARRRAA